MEALINFVQNEFIEKKDLPKFDAGDTLTVYYQIREGEKVTEILAQIKEDPEVGILVLGANPSGEGPGPLVSQLVGRQGGILPVPVTIVPGSMTKEAIIAVS